MHEKCQIGEKVLERLASRRSELKHPFEFIENAGLNKPRYPSLPSMIMAQRKEIEQYNIEALGLSLKEVGSGGSKTHTDRLSASKPRPKRIFTPDSSLSATERMRLIMSGGIAEKKGDLLAGDATELAAKLIQFLGQQKLLPQ